MEREDKVRLLQALEERERRKRAAPLAYFRPHEKQRQFLEGFKNHRISKFIGGNRSGKSTIMVVLLICVLYGYYIHEAAADGIEVIGEDGDYLPREKIPPQYWVRRSDGLPLRPQRTALLVTGLSMPKGIGGVIWPEMEVWLPEALLRRAGPQRGPLSTPVKYVHPDGMWTLHFGSIEQGSMVFEGAKYDFACFDEPPTRSVYTAVWRGCIDYCASVAFSYTPLGHNAQWLFTEFIADSREDVAVVKVAQSDNPHLSPEALAEFEASVQWSEEELLARKQGEFGFLTFRAYPMFGDVHVVDPFPVPKHWPRICSCDPASRRPFYFLWLAYDEQRETWIAYREFPDEKLHHQYRTSDWGIQDYATLIRNLEGEERVDARCIDPRFGVAEYTVKGQKSTSVCDDLARYGLYFDPNVPDTGREETGIERVRELLWYDSSREVTEMNRPRLLITKNCRSLIHSLQNYSFVPPNARDDRILPDKTNEAFKDPADTLRYAVLYGRPARIDRMPNSYISDLDWERENAIDDSWL